MLSYLDKVPTELADKWLAAIEQMDFTKHQVRVFGQVYDEPRTRIHFGAVGTNYSYSGSTNPGVGLPPVIVEIIDYIRSARGSGKSEDNYNFVLINRFADNSDNIGWHSDDESTIIKDTSIASLTLGASRDFQIRPLHRAKAKLPGCYTTAASAGASPPALPVPTRTGASNGKSYKSSLSKTGTTTLELDHGALIVMESGFQSHYAHCIPKRAPSKQRYYNGSPVRISLTFRVVKGSAVGPLTAESVPQPRRPRSNAVVRGSPAEQGAPPAE